MTPLHISLGGALLTGLLLGLVDQKTGLMPNALTYSSLLLALLLRGATEGLEGSLSAGLGLLIVASPPAIMYFMTSGQAIGGGDVKALAALGAWLGPALGLEVELLSFLLLAFYSWLQAVRNGSATGLLRRSFSLLIPKSLRDSQQAAPMTFVRFGPFLLAGTLIAVLAAMVPSGHLLPWIAS